MLSAPLAIAALDSAASIRKGFLLGGALTLVLFSIYISTYVVCSKVLESQYALLAALMVCANLRGPLFIFLTGVLGISVRDNILNRYFGSSVATIFWLGLSIQLIWSNEQFKRRYNALVTQASLTEMTYEIKDESSYKLLLETLKRVKVGLSETRAFLVSSKGHTEEMLSLNANLESHIQENVRQVSHDLWRQAIDEMPKLKYSTLFRKAVDKQHYRISTLVAIYFITSFFNLISSRPLHISLLKSLVGAIVLFVGDSLLRSLKKRIPIADFFLNLSLFFSVGFISAATAMWSFDDFNVVVIFITAVAFGALIAVLMLALSAISLTKTSREELLGKLHYSFQSDYQRKLQLASYLHNSLQSELSMIFLLIEAEASKLGTKNYDVIVEKLDAAIYRLTSDGYFNYFETPLERFSKIIESWSSIVEILVEVDINLFQDKSKASIFVQVVEETLANAIRKGGATTVRIKADISEKGIEVAITSNSEISGSQRFGFGRAWIDQISQVSSSLLPDNAGSSITLVI